MDHLFIDPYNWSTIEPLYLDLEKCDLELTQVEAWLQRWSKIEMVLHEASAQAYRMTTEDITNSEALKNYRHLMNEITPRAKSAAYVLKQRLLSIHDLQMNANMQELLRRFRCEIQLFHEENINLQSIINITAQEYMALTGSMTIIHEGLVITIPEAESLLEDGDRYVREKVWRFVTHRRMEDKQNIDSLFLKLFHLRRALASNKDLPDYRAYRWMEMNRLDYNPDDCFQLHNSIELEIVPLWLKMIQKRKNQLGLSVLRPWDMRAYPQNLSPLRPFTSVDRLQECIGYIFTELDPELSGLFKYICNGPLDLMARPGKAPGAYCYFLPISRHPYIFMNAVGTNQDIMTFLHETGHAFHALLSYHNHSLYWFTIDLPIEFAEVASQGLELLILPYLTSQQGGFYDEEEINQATFDELEGLIKSILWSTISDIFQHWLYVEASDNIGIDEINTKWAELINRFMPGIDWAGLEEVQRSDWHVVSHLFLLPFYMIEYAIAGVGALQLWEKAQHDLPATLEDYRTALSLGSSKSLPDLYASAGIRLAFDQLTIGKLARLITQHLRLE